MQDTKLEAGPVAARPSRRTIMKWGVAGTLGGMMAGSLTMRAVAQAPGKVKFIHPTPATLVLASVTYLAEDLGYYKEEGLEVERQPLNGGPAAMTALLAGEGLTNVSAPGELLAAAARGQGVKIIESYANYDPFALVVTKAYAQKLGISAASSLAEREAALAASKGAYFAVTAPGSQTDLTTRLALSQVGLNPATDVIITPLGNIVNVISALSQDRIEGAILLSPFTQQATRDLGVVTILNSSKGEIPASSRMQGQVLEARTGDVETQPDTFAAIVRADVKALKLIVDSPDEARDRLRQTRFSAVDETIWPDVWATQLPTFRSPRVTRDGLQAWIETGAVGGDPDPETFPYDKVIDMQFVDAALTKLGWDPDI